MTEAYDPSDTDEHPVSLEALALLGEKYEQRRLARQQEAQASVGMAAGELTELKVVPLEIDQSEQVA